MDKIELIHINRQTQKKKKKKQKTGKSNIKFINYCLKFKYMNKILMIYKLPSSSFKYSIEISFRGSWFSIGVRARAREREKWFGFLSVALLFPSTGPFWWNENRCCKVYKLPTMLLLLSVTLDCRWLLAEFRCWLCATKQHKWQIAHRDNSLASLHFRCSHRHHQRFVLCWPGQNRVKWQIRHR